jgi:glucose-6-phosphate isomerase
MIHLNLKNIFAVDSTHGLSKKELSAQKKDMVSLINNMHARGQQFYSIVDDHETIKEVESFAKKMKNKYKHVVVIGIGGSALGAVCLHNALKHLYDKEQKKRTSPTLHVLDNVDPIVYAELEDVIDLKKTLFLIISKSGNTAEALGPFLYFQNKIKKLKHNIKDHFVAITHPGNGLLSELAEKEHMHVITHGDVGGRFAVLSTVGLVPAALIGIDIKKLIAGAKDMRDQFFTPDASKNLPYQIAKIQYELSKKKKSITVMMPYAQKLLSFADWYRQLLAESIGKELNDSGRKVNTGITPVKALGTTDQHSQAQLYNEGPNDKLIMFIHVKQLYKKLQIPTIYKKYKQLAYLQGASFNDLMDAEREGTVTALTKRDRPNMTITIDKIDEYHMGALFMLFEGSVALLGEMYNINAFNQPGVELAKRLTVKNLGRMRKK